VPRCLLAKDYEAASVAALLLNNLNYLLRYLINSVYAESRSCLLFYSFFSQVIALFADASDFKQQLIPIQTHF